MTEDRVVDAVCRFLTASGYDILARSTAMERGNDIEAVKNTTRLIVEAKGAGSSKSWTARYGEEFNRGQVFDHVAKAVLKALRVVAAGEAKAGIALPDNDAHHHQIEQVATALDRLGVTVFWVGDNLDVSAESPGAI